MKGKKILLLAALGVIVILFNLSADLFERYKFPLAAELDRTASAGVTDISKETNEQLNQRSEYNSVKNFIREKLIYAFLICAAFFIVYGLSRFRVIIPVTLGTLAVSFLVEYIVQYFSTPFTGFMNGIVLYYFHEFLLAGIWILVPLAYYALWKKIKKDTEADTLP